MPTLEEIHGLLTRYRERFAAVDLFVDDVEELAQSRLPADTYELSTGDGLRLMVPSVGQGLEVEVLKDRGVARFRLTKATRDEMLRDANTKALVAGGLTFSAITAAGAAAKAGKEGLLGGMIFALFIGAIVHAANTPPDYNRIMTLLYEPESRDWKLYDGPYLHWAKSALAA
jgi:hypothetical protein